MKLDITTILFIASLVYATQTIALFMQFRFNKAYSGLGFWLLGSLSQAGGFFLMPLVNAKSVWFLSALANPLIVLGLLFLDAGAAAFLGKKESGWFAAAAFIAFILPYFYFMLLRNSIFARSILVDLATAALSVKVACSLFRGKRDAFAGSAGFTASVFVAYALAQLAMTAVTVALPPLASYADIYQRPIRAISFVVPIAVSMLWTFGFILMINQRLNAESLEEKEKLRLIFEISPDAQLITRLRDGSIVDVNSEFLSITGHSREDVIGNSIESLLTWANQEDRQRYLSELGEMESVRNREFAFLRKDKSQFVGMISGSKIMIDGQPHLITVVQDITERRRSEERIGSLLSEKELILREVHHRIKNNMSTICGLLSLQAGAMADPPAAAALHDAESRVRSMLVLYDKLYTSSSFDELSTAQYFPPLIDEIVANFPGAASVRIEEDIDDFSLGIGTLQPLGIIVNELLTNIMKYAFGGEAGNSIRISLSRKDGRVTLVVADNGQGMPESVSFEDSRGFGLTLVRALTQQLRGKVSIERGKGTRIILELQG
jgi:PAS domain S-box-containing protein